MRKTKLLRHFFLIISGTILLSFFSCSPEYIPNVANTPMFDGKGELQANIVAGASGTDIQAAYAITDNIGIMANTSFLNQVSDTSDDFHKHSIYELGVGYYGDISDYGRFEIYGGYGGGKLEGYDENNIFDDAVTDATFSKLFIQPSFGLKSKYFDGNLGTRLSMVKINYSHNPEDIKEGFTPFLEPVLTGRLGIENIKLISQIGLSFPLTEEHSFDYQPIIFSIGLHFKINTLGSDSDN